MFLGLKSYACFWDVSNGSLEGSRGTPKRALGAAFVIKIRLKTNTFFELIFFAFLKVLGNFYFHAADLTSPPHLRSRVLDHFWSRIVKTPCVFALFAKRRFWHPVYLSFSLVFFLSVTAQSPVDAAGSRGLRHSADPFDHLQVKWKGTYMSFELGGCQDSCIESLSGGFLFFLSTGVCVYCEALVETWFICDWYRNRIGFVVATQRECDHVRMRL